MLEEKYSRWEVHRACSNLAAQSTSLLQSLWHEIDYQFLSTCVFSCLLSRLNTTKMSYLVVGRDELSQPWFHGLPHRISLSQKRGKRATIEFGIKFWQFQCNLSFLLRKMVPGGGFEPPTRGFSIRCSTNWAIRACKFKMVVIVEKALDEWSSWGLRYRAFILTCPVG